MREQILVPVENDSFLVWTGPLLKSFNYKLAYSNMGGMRTTDVSISVVDLFCGAGGLTHGLEKAGLKVIAGIDADEGCKYPYERNNNARFMHRDLRSVDPTEVAALYPENCARVLVGCAPCQPFTRLGNLKCDPIRKDWDLLNAFTMISKAVMPDIISMENVHTLIHHEVYKQFMLSLSELGYSVNANLVDCQKYGVPQTRKRLVVLASKLGEISLLPPLQRPKSRTVRQTIGALPPLMAGEADPSDTMHRARNLTPINLKRIRQSKPGGTWLDWERQLRLECHKREGGSSFDSVYGRMEWDKPSPTITTQFSNMGSGRFGHPEQDRAITPREAAMLQTFGKDYKFIGPGEPFSFSRLGRWIGNAVPVRLGRVIGDSIKAHIVSEYPSRGEREKAAE